MNPAKQEHLAFHQCSVIVDADDNLAVGTQVSKGSTPPDWPGTGGTVSGTYLLLATTTEFIFYHSRTLIIPQVMVIISLLS